jgi:DNA/RNA-binding domain of Phe-tRNA-synthetase-like protein
MLQFTIALPPRAPLDSALFGLVTAHDVKVQPHVPALGTLLDELGERLRVELAGKAAADRAPIAATRRAYRALGDDPTHYRPANEALLRRVLGRRAFPEINTIVDINNYVSLESGFALGCYDLRQIAGPVTVRAGAAGETYAPIGKPAVDAARRLVLADDQGIFGSPTADSQRTMVTETTAAVLFVIFAFEAAADAVERAVARSAALLDQFCGATIDEQRVIGAGVPDAGTSSADQQ